MSIDPRELRIGNWANYDGKTPGYVMEFDLKQVKLKCKASTLTIRSNRNVSFLDIDPIPLTPEILIAAGFVKCSCGGYKNIIHLSANDFGKVYYRAAPLESLHQLQNLIFALTGEELTIKL